MLIDQDEKHLPHKGRHRHLIIGNFDGIHLGHQQLLKTIPSQPRSDEIERGVLTFEPSVREYFCDKQKVPYSRLTTFDEKNRLFSSLKLDFVAYHAFDERLEIIEAIDFFGKIQDLYAPDSIGTGEDFRCGHRRAWGITEIREWCDHHSIELVVCPLLRGEETKISSSQIKEWITAGSLENANRSLGRAYSIEGTVIHGAGRGTPLGFPTSNLTCPHQKLIPQIGTYITLTHVGSQTYPSATNIGWAPTLEGQRTEPIIETHILDFSESLYGQSITIEFHEYLRKEQRFNSIEELITQIKNDTLRVREYFSQSRW